MKKKCQHCGRRFAGEAEEDFCCGGCAQVYALIQREGLDDYYDLQDRAGRPLGEIPSKSKDYDWARAAQAEAETGAGSTAQVELGLSGMTCMGCIWLVDRLARRADGLLRGKASLAGQSLRLEWRPGAFDLAGFLGLLQRFGYEARPGASGGGWLDGLAWRTLLCLIFAFNLGFLALAERHLETEFARSGLLDLLQILFLLLSAAVGAVYFWLPVVRALRLGYLHFDLFAALGLAVAALSALGREAGLGFLPVDASGFGLAVAVLLLVRRLQIAMVARGRPQVADRADRMRGIRRWMSAGYYLSIFLLLAGAVWLVFERGLSSAGSSLLVALFALVLYPAELGVEEGRTGRVVGSAMLLGVSGGPLALLGGFGLAAALAWHAILGWALVFCMAKPAKPGDSSR